MDERPSVGPAQWKLGYRPALDGVRGVALLMVFIGHAGWPLTPNRAHEFGVELFFVLSGFLITALLLDEYRSTGSIDVRAFYLRRARRLMPALGALLVGMFVLFKATSTFDADATRNGILGGATYSSGILAARGVDLGPLAHLWSLSVEEHFYLLWPLIAVAALGKRLTTDRAVQRFLLVAVALMAGSYCWRWWLARSDYGLEWTRMYTSTDTRVAAPLLGCVLGILLTRLPFAVPRSIAICSLVMGFSTLAWLSLGPGITDFPMYWTQALPMAEFASALICLGAATTDSPLTVALGTRPIGWIGRMSYSAYLWHYPIFILVGGDLTQLSTSETGWAVTLSLLAAAISERLVERPFRRITIRR